MSHRRAVVPAPRPPAPPALALGPLPPDLSLLVLLRLPLRERVRAECVCRAWCAALRAPLLWRRLDASPLGAAATDAVVDSLAARAGPGGLRRLDVSGCPRVSVRALLRATAPGAAAPAGLRITAPALWWSSDQVRARRRRRRGAREGRARATATREARLLCLACFAVCPAALLCGARGAGAASLSRARAPWPPLPALGSTHISTALCTSSTSFFVRTNKPNPWLGTRRNARAPSFVPLSFSVAPHRCTTRLRRTRR
jgi:hypothetical protein